MKRVIPILIICVAFFSAVHAHPVHVSVCNLDFGKKSLEISVKLFRDDLSDAIDFETGIKADLMLFDSQEKEKIVCHYIRTKMKIFLNGNDELKLEYKGYTIKEDALWMNFYAEVPQNINNLKVENTMLVDSFPDQTNLLIVNFMGKQRGYQFNHDQRVMEPKLPSIKK